MFVSEIFFSTIFFLMFTLVWTQVCGLPGHILPVGAGRGGGVAGSRPIKKGLEECWKLAGAV
jgi:hypothetical protein